MNIQAVVVHATTHEVAFTRAQLLVALSNAKEGQWQLCLSLDMLPSSMQNVCTSTLKDELSGQPVSAQCDNGVACFRLDSKVPHVFAAVQM